jgi:CHAD domain-containing protein
VRRAGAELVAALPNARAATDVEAAHDARIRAKRLRYLVEPLADTPVGPRARRLVRSLKELQDVLGELHDLHVLADDIGASLVEHAAERARSRHAALYATNGTPRAPDLAPGLRALDRRARDEIERRFEELHARWSGARLATLAAEVSALVAALDRHAERARRSAARVRRRPLATRRP